MDALIDGVSRLSPAAWACAGFAVLAVVGLLRPPAGRLRAAADESPPIGAGRWTRESSWLAGRSDGLGLRARLLLGAVAASGVCLAASRFEPGPGAWAWLGWPVLAGAVGVLLGRLEPRNVRRRRERLIADVPQALDLLAACLAAGLPVRLAGRAVVEAFGGPVGEDLGRVLALADLGVPESEAWRTLADHPQLGPAASDLSRSVESGTLMVAALGRHAAAAREAQRTELVVRARSVGVRSVLPLMTCFIPAFLLLGVVPTVASALSAALG